MILRARAWAFLAAAFLVAACAGPPAQKKPTNKTLTLGELVYRTIEQNLEPWAVGPAEYLRMLAFVDGSGETLCRREDVMLVSMPNVPRVIVCPGFARVQRLQPGAAANMVIHEVLHTLGLGENPPTSIEITHRVEVRCR